jgi:transposase InsO family protein
MFSKLFGGVHGEIPREPASTTRDLLAVLADGGAEPSASTEAANPTVEVTSSDLLAGIPTPPRVEERTTEYTEVDLDTAFERIHGAADFDSKPMGRPRLVGPRPGGKAMRSSGKPRVEPAESSNSAGRASFTPQQRLLLLDTWTRSGLPAGDFASLVGVSKHTLYAWKKRFDEEGPAGLVELPRGAQGGSRLPELTRRTILMLKTSHPDWGCQRISDTLARGPALGASPGAVAKVLHEAGYETVEEPTRAHGETPKRFERAEPNQLWQTDLFTFVLKRQNRRVYLVAFMDDHSRFLVSYGLHATASTALVREVLEAGISGYGVPREVLTDNGPQYVTWRGKSQFTRHLEKRGIQQIVARPRRPQTLGKIERFWGTLWRECVESAVFLDLADARRRIGLFIDHYNFQRAHQGLDGLVPADRFFGAASEVRRALQTRVAENALELARHGNVSKPFYLMGQLEGKPFSVHRAGERLVLTRSGEEREEWEIDGGTGPAEPITLPDPVCPAGNPRDMELAEPALGVGESALDEGWSPSRMAEEERGASCDASEGGAQ